jgi:hypothetical protein
VPSKTIRPPSWPRTGDAVDDPVGVRHDRPVVLGDDERLPGVDQPVEKTEQLLDVGQMQAGGRLVEDIDGALPGHVGGQLEPLSFPTGERGERLSHAEVAESDLGEPLEDGVRCRGARVACAEEVLRFPSHSSQVVATPAIIARSV